MNNTVKTLLLLFVFSTCLLLSSCSQPDDLVYLNKETVIDVDGNEYQTLTINGQIWMAENLRTTRYRNGDLIDAGPINKNDNEFFDLSKEYQPKYQWPCDGKESLVEPYGRLYTWYAATDSRNICPIGWHLPSDEEWEAMRTYLIKKDFGRYDKKGNRKDETAIGIALAADYSYWAGPNHSTSFFEDVIGTDFTEHNTTGFSAYPAGCYFGDFVKAGYLAIWRSTSPENSWNMNFLGNYLHSGQCDIYYYPLRYFGTKPYEGYSIRCVKDGSKPEQKTDTTHSGVIKMALTDPIESFSNSAKFGLTIMDDGGLNILDRGLCWSTSAEPNVNLITKSSFGSGKEMVVSRITGLSANTTYYVRSYATNYFGTCYSNEVQFTTPDYLLDLFTSIARSITSTSATLEGTICAIENMDIITKGICWNTSPHPTIGLTTKTEIGLDSAIFAAKIIGLNHSTDYYTRAYVISNQGIFYGNEVHFKTKSMNVVTDVDGNVYEYKKIGSHTWMTENLKTTKYRDGTPIPNVVKSLDWNNRTSGAYANYANDSKNADIYGRLYNWYAICDSRNLAPTGWHVATKSEWDTLIVELGGIDIATSKIKETGTDHWISNDYGTNESGFTALPGGFCDQFLQFMRLGDEGYWWCFTNDFAKKAYMFHLDSMDFFGFSGMMLFNSIPNGEMKYGMSVRCVKDE